jgi:hypothetical protein
VQIVAVLSKVVAKPLARSVAVQQRVGLAGADLAGADLAGEGQNGEGQNGEGQNGVGLGRAGLSRVGRNAVEVAPVAAHRVVLAFSHRRWLGTRKLLLSWPVSRAGRLEIDFRAILVW